jgi:hypothetical protein
MLVIRCPLHFLGDFLAGLDESVKLGNSNFQHVCTETLKANQSKQHPKRGGITFVRISPTVIINPSSLGQRDWEKAQDVEATNVLNRDMRHGQA